MTDTAYTDNSAFEYDKIRFESPQGKLFHLLECNELEKRLRSLDKSASVVEVGCGTGRFLPLAARYSDHVTGIDPSDDMLHLTKVKVATIPSIQLLKGEGAVIPLRDNTIDFVYAIRTLNQVGTKDYAHRMIKELFRICQPGGNVLLEFVNSKSLNRATADVRFTSDELCQFLETEQLGTVENRSGILFFSQTILNKTPSLFIPIYHVLDRIFSKLIPRYCTRCYILVKKF